LFGFALHELNYRVKRDKIRWRVISRCIRVTGAAEM